MNADEIFNELGYEKRVDKDDNPNYCTYIKYNKSPSCGVTISFSLNYETVCADTFDEDYEMNVAHCITPLELQAINEKCEELRMDKIIHKQLSNVLKTEIKYVMQNEENQQEKIDKINTLFNLKKIIDNYDELEPLLQEFFNKKYQQQKWGERE